jgi:anti-anti-sigma regulatory factor
MDMTNRVCPVKIERLPETFSEKQVRLFLRSLEGYVKIDRPSLVLDCSEIRQMDKPAINLLLCLLEESMKRNGDVKLAGVPQEAMGALELAGVDRLFEIFETNAEAVNSFRRRQDDQLSEHVSFGSLPTPDNAA